MMLSSSTGCCATGVEARHWLPTSSRDANRIVTGASCPVVHRRRDLMSSKFSMEPTWRVKACTGMRTLYQSSSCPTLLTT
jgi:hypothetical protein